MSDTQFNWMREAIYEPREQRFEQPRPSRFWRAFGIIAVLVMIGCGLAGVN